MSQPSQPKAPNYNKLFEQGIQTYLKYLPQMLSAEQASREQYDPLRIQQQQALQAKYGPTQYSQELAALHQLDPLGTGLRAQLGNTISDVLSRGYVDPQQAAAYRAMGAQTLGDYNRGYQVPPQLQREIAQGIAARQAATGNATGNAADMAAAVYQGQRAQQLYQQRTQNLQGFLQNQSPEALAIAESGAFSSLPGPVQQLGGVQGVTPDRAYAYFNPNAGPQAAQFGLQNYPNQVYGANQPNPWMNSLGGAAGGALTGAQIGSVFPGYGTLIGAGVGAIGGGLTGYFSDPTMKTDVRKVGSVPIYKYKYKPQFGIKGTFKGPMSTDIKKFAPQAVRKVFGKDFVTSPNSLGLNRQKVT